MAKIAPSILAADFLRLGVTLDQCRQGGADQIHVDVMDGHFVPNLTIGPVVIEDLRKWTDLPLDVHLMIENPDRFIVQFKEAGANYLTVHVEACDDHAQVIHCIKDEGMKAGISLRPGTPISAIGTVLAEVDLVLVMSVEPGCGGQEFIPESVARIRQLRGMIGSVSKGKRPEISVDGGIKLYNAQGVIDAGADVLVVGSGIFDEDDPVAAIRQFRDIE